MRQVWRSWLLLLELRVSLTFCRRLFVMPIMVSLTDNPTSTGVDPTTCARSLAAFVKANDLDGVDIDYEDSQAFNTGTAEAWLISESIACPAFIEAGADAEYAE
jgi:hypothetical protein